MFLEITLANALILAMCLTSVTLQFLRTQIREADLPDESQEAVNGYRKHCQHCDDIVMRDMATY